MSSVKSDSLKGLKWTGIEKLSVHGVQFFLGIIMARLLSPEDFGTVGMIAVFISFSQTFVDSGFSNALIRKINRTEKDFCTVFYFNIVIALFCYCLLFFAAPYIAVFFHIPILCKILRIQAVVLVLNSFMGVQVAKLIIDINFKALAQRNVLAVILSGVIGVVLAYRGWGLWAIVAQSIANSVINLTFILFYCRWVPRYGFCTESFKDLWNFGSKLLASGILQTLYSNLTPLIIGRYFSSRDLGVYSRGTHLAKYPADIINDMIGKVSFPVLSKIQNDDAHLIRVYRKYIAMSSIIVFFACTLMCALAKPLVIALLTEKWMECIIYLQVFCFSIMFDHVCRINLNLLQVKGRSDLFLKLEIVKKSIALLILFASIPFGVIGICISKVIYSQIAVFINTYYTGKLFNLGYWTQVKDFFPFLLLSILCCIPAFFIAISGLNNIMCLILGSLSSLFIYLFLLRNNPYATEVKSMAKDIFSRRKK